ncbi:MAG: hypothetical protein OSA98_15700 [Rubripirellula sp.]|nr:hypothetical protein [Rubripirellula sp.]
MTIANRLSILLPCCLVLISISASAGDHENPRKKPGRTTYSKTASGVTDTEIEALATEYAMMAALKGYSDSEECRCRRVRKNPVRCHCPEDDTDGASPGVGWDVGPLATEYAMMASLLGYSDSEAIEYGIIVALIHARTGRTDSGGVFNPSTGRIWP